MTIALVVLVLLAGVAHGDDRPLAGTSLLVADPSGVETARRVTVVGMNGSGATPPLSDPRPGGATLSVGANGGTVSSDTFLLDAAGWQAVGPGFRYRGPTGADGDAVRRVTLTRSGTGRYKLRADLTGRTGTQLLAIVPPNPGSDALLVLEVTGGDRYCVAFGGAAGGTVKKNDARRWKVVNAVATSCPAPPTTTTTTTTTSTTTTTTTTTTTSITTTTVIPGVCGNGTVEPGEECEGFPNFCGTECGPPGTEHACRCCLPPGPFVVPQSLPLPCCLGGYCEQTGVHQCTCPDPTIPPCGEATPYPTCGDHCSGIRVCTAFHLAGGDATTCACHGPFDPFPFCPDGPFFCPPPSIIEVTPGGGCTCAGG